MSAPGEPTGLAATASKSIEESVQEEHEVLGDQPDTGRLVPQDDAQSAPPTDGPDDAGSGSISAEVL